MDFSLSFSQVKCLECAATRVAGVPCPDCGAKPAPHEADSDRQIRQRRSRKAQELLRSPSAPGGTMSVDEVTIWDATRQCLQGLIDALPLASNPDPSYDEALLPPVESLLALKGATRASARRRPWLYLWQQADKTVGLVGDVFAYSLAALSADTPVEAQNQAAQLREALNSATDELEELSKRADFASVLAEAETAFDTSAALFTEAYERSGARTIMELDAAGRDIYSNNVGGASAPAPLGLGVSIILTDVEADVLLDKERMWALISELSSYIAERSRTFASFAAEDGWKQDYKRSVQHLHDAVASHRHTLSRVPQPRIAVHSVMSLAMDLAEATRPMLASLVALKGGSSYQARREGNSGDLLKILEDRGHANIHAGLEPTLRNARAHLNFDIREGLVTLFPNSPGCEEVAVDDLVDRVLMGYETVLAIQSALSVAAYTFIDLGYGELDPIAFLDIPLEDRVMAVMKAVGFEPESADHSEDSLEIRVASEVTGSSFTLATSILPYLPVEVETIGLEDTAGNRLAGPLAPVRAWDGYEEESLEREIELWRTQYRWTINGRPIMGTEYLRKMVAVAAGSAQAASYKERVRRLKLLRDFCLDYGDRDMADSIKAALKLNRLREMGHRAEQHDLDRLNLLTHYEGLRLPCNPG